MENFPYIYTLREGGTRLRCRIVVAGFEKCLIEFENGYREIVDSGKLIEAKVN